MSLLLQITLILGLALCIQQFAQRFQLIAILGYLTTGILVGSSGFAIIDLSSDWQSISQFILCIFALYLGLQIKPQSVWDLRQQMITQALAPLVISTLCFSSLIYFVLLLPFVLSLLLGVVAALPSHLIIQATLKHAGQSKSHLAQQHGVIAISSIVCLIVTLAAIQLYSGANTLYHALAYTMLLVAMISGLLLFSRYLMQPLLRQVSTKQPQLLLTTAIAIALAVMTLAQSLGIHLVLASLFAGMLLADSEYRTEFNRSLKPIQPMIMGSLWLILGASLSISTLLQHYEIVVAAIVVLIVIKCTVYTALSYWLNSPWQQQLRLAALCGQMGELSFILLFVLKHEQLLELAPYQLMLAILMSSVLLSPLLQYAAVKPWKKYEATSDEAITDDALATPPKNKLIIAGFGRVGQLIARVAHSQQHAFTAIDNSIQNAEFVSQYAGHMIYGDACDTHVLKQAQIEQAELFVLAIDDIEDSMNVARYLRLNFPELNILARARDRHHAHLLRDLGIDYIWRESYASSLDMAYRMLCDLGTAQQDAKIGVQRFRIHDEQLLKEQHAVQSTGMKAYTQFDNPMHELEHLFAQDARFIRSIEASIDEQARASDHAA